MNSMSNYSNNDKNKKPDCCPTIVKCNTNPTSTSFPIGSTIPETVATVDLNACHLKNPCTKIDFAANISVLLGGLVSLRFQVFKAPCSNLSNRVAVGNPFTYTNTLGVAGSTIVNFSVCDCNNNCNNNYNCNCDYNSCCKDCYVYTVVVTPVIAVAVATTVSNATIGLVSTCSTNNCCCQA